MRDTHETYAYIYTYIIIHHTLQIRCTSGKSRWSYLATSHIYLLFTEMRYAQIEKEALAFVYACKKFSDYVLGKPVLLETDHNPLIPILGSNSLDTLPPRVLHFHIYLMWFQCLISHIPGKTLYCQIFGQLESHNSISFEQIGSSPWAMCFDSWLSLVARAAIINWTNLSVSEVISSVADTSKGALKTCSKVT